MAIRQQEILMFVSRHLGLLTQLASHTVEISFNEFFAFENMTIASGIVYCLWNCAATLYTG